MDDKKVSLTPDDIRKLYEDEEPATPEEARQTAEEARNDPDAARALWAIVCAQAGTGDDQFEAVFRSCLDSIVLDIIGQHLRNDDFALMLGRRIFTLMDMMKPGWVEAATEPKPQAYRAGHNRHKGKTTKTG